MAKYLIATEELGFFSLIKSFNPCLVYHVINMSHPNKAIYMLANGKHEIRTIEEPYIPQKAQSLVEVQYSAINPADTRHSYMDMSEYVAGYEYTGTVRAVGPESPFTVGQEIFGQSLPYDHRPNYLGAHQSFLLAEPL